MQYLFDKWTEIQRIIKNKYIFFFLDFDGTLTSIAPTPDRVIISKETKDILIQLSKAPKCKVAIISGRSLKDLKNIVSLKNIIYSGNHGLEIEGPKIKFENEISPRLKEIIGQIKNDLAIKLSKINGIFIEDKKLSLSIHYRLVNKKYIPLIKNILKEITEFYLIRKKIKIDSGKRVFEIKADIGWNKGKVVLWLLAREQFLLKDNEILPIYIGDDTTDEDAFKALKNRGITIFVGKPRYSYAKYYLKNVKEVEKFLIKILTIKNI
ncbi:MAG: trehalose-phosphatase [Candidatus Omnitrophota bacterium]